MLLIKNCIVVSKDEEKEVDVKIKDGVIEQIANTIDAYEGYELLDAKGSYLLPGIVDLNVRVENDALNIPNLEKLHQSTQKGGVTSFVLSPRFLPLVENQTFMQLLSTELAQKYPALTLSIKALKDKELTKLNDISTLSKYDIKVIQENSFINSNLTRRIMQYAKMNNTTFFTFCENLDLNDGGVMNDGEVSFRLGVPGISKIGEISEVSKMVQMSLFYDVKTHFQALSTKESLQLISDVKKEFPKISSEVSIHHLVLDDLACDDFNTYAKLNPPLRSQKDKGELLEALKDGKIDTITSLHSPKSVLYKDVAFKDAMFGIDSVEDFMALCYTFLVKEGVISLWELMRLISYNPAKILGVENIGKVKEGFAANLILFDPKVSKIVKDKHSVYRGKALKGNIWKCILSENYR